MTAVRLTNEKIAELKGAFMLFDYNKTGNISMRDIGPVIRSIGLKPSEAEVQDIMTDVQQMGGEVDLSTLVQLIGQKVTNPPAESPENLREMFRMYDKDGSGWISAKEMRHLLTSVGEKLTEEEAEELLKMTNCLKGDQVDCNKFIQTVLRG